MIGHIIKTIESCKFDAELVRAELLKQGFKFREHSRWVLSDPNCVYALKVDVQNNNRQNINEINFYTQILPEYRKFFPSLHWRSTCTLFLITEFVPFPIRHVSDWELVMQNEKFISWCLSQGLDHYDLHCFDSWRLTKDRKVKLVDFGS